VTHEEREALWLQADRAAARVSGWPAWQQELAASTAREAGTDVEPRVSARAVARVKQALGGAPPVHEA